MTKLSAAGREELALALLLWKDFKSEGRFDPELIKMAVMFADVLGVRKEFDGMLSKLPPMRIEPR